MSAQWGPVIGSVSAPPPVAEKPKGKSFFKRKQFIIAGGVMVLILAYLIYVGVIKAGMYYMTVTELMAKRDTLAPGEQVRVQGKVLSDSIIEDKPNNTIRFTVSDGQNSLPVVYTGVVPDSFKPDADVVLEGALTASGSFQATNLLAKCASKYNPLSG